MGTIRRNGHALRGPKIHYGLIKIIRPGAGEQLLGQGGNLLFSLGGIGGGGNTENPAQHAVDITVYHGIGHFVGKGANGGCGIIAHAFKGAHALVRGGKYTAHTLRRRMQIARAAIITQSFPIFKHLILRGSRQGFYIREAAHETNKIVIPLRHTGLLQDNFGNPNLVRVPDVAPRQRAFMHIIPSQQDSGKIFHIRNFTILTGSGAKTSQSGR